MKHIFFMILLFYFSSENLFSQNKDFDTLPALVQYGNTFVFDETFYPVSNPILKMDSLLSLDNENKGDLVFLKKYFYANSGEKLLVIDSLFELEKVRYDLINELQRMMFYYKDEVAEISIALNDFTGDSEFPSNEIYRVWNTKLIWNHLEVSTDSSFIIPLIESKTQRKYSHPVCFTTLKKYGGLVTSKQGWRDGKRHNGVDVNCDQWDSVNCAFDGRVRFAKEYEGYGKVVVVRHFNGLETLYAHLAKIKVKPGQKISAGELIGLAGSTGNSEGSHLHFEVRFKDQVLNPENIIDFKNQKLRSDTLIIRKTGNSFVGVPSTNQVHIIERGDYPMKVATRYGMDISTFTNLNQITNKTKLKVGDTVLIQ